MTPAAQATPKIFAGLVPLGSLRTESKANLARSARLLEQKAGKDLIDPDPAVEHSLYLLDGSIELVDASGERVGTLRSGTQEALSRIAWSQSGGLKAICITDVRYLAVNTQLLDVMLTWDQTDMLEVGVVNAETHCESDDWMVRLLHARAFQMVPPANLQTIFMRMEQVEVRAGQTIVRQGEVGDYFYVITEGRCTVMREQPGRASVHLADLGAGSVFGEEALISDDPRNATVFMLTDGKLMRLAKDDFHALLKEPLTRRLSRAEADARVGRGAARYLDVRLSSEFRTHSLPGSLNVPLYLLRMRLPPADPATAYICVCDTGRRSAVASFVLTQKGYDAYILADGIGGR
ncbi:MAG: cyclic nucleotide-binding domain-containing protein [Panacagrimonas sp.]